MSDDKKRILTDMQRAFLHYLATDAKGNVRSAMKLAGYSDNARAGDIYESLTDEIIEVAKKLLAANSVKAALSMVGVLDDPTMMGADKAIMAAKEIMDRAGLVKKELSNTQIKADAIFILPAKDGTLPETME